MITVVDSIMGSGKTTCIVNMMQESHSRSLGLSFADQSTEVPRFLYVAPTLSEVDRITEECSALDFRNPEPIEGRKLYHLSTLIEEGANICTTHALFRLLNREIYTQLRQQKYTLIVDEVLDCVSMYEGLTPSDRKLLFRDNLIYVEPGTNKLRWNHRDHANYSGHFNRIRNLCDNGNLALYRDTALIWEFPTDFLRCFEQVFILTYLFQGSPMSAYLRAEGLTYEMVTLRDRQLVPWSHGPDEGEVKRHLRSLITVYDGPANKWGERKPRENPMSSTWYDNRKPEELAKLKASTEHWYKHHAQTQANENAWTTFSKVRPALKGARYSRNDCWIANNAKATNDFRHKKSLAYLCNVFYHPYIRGYFEDRGIAVHEHLYALSEMIQWIWRSQIRDGLPITVFIPSERMRNLFLTWLNGSSVAEIAINHIVENHHQQAA